MTGTEYLLRKVAVGQGVRVREVFAQILFGAAYESFEILFVKSWFSDNLGEDRQDFLQVWQDGVDGYVAGIEYVGRLQAGAVELEKILQLGSVAVASALVEQLIGSPGYQPAGFKRAPGVEDHLYPQDRGFGSTDCHYFQPVGECPAAGLGQIDPSRKANGRWFRK